MLNKIYRHKIKGISWYKLSTLVGRPQRGNTYIVDK